MPKTGPTIDEYVELILAEVPPLTDEQQSRLAEIFRPIALPRGETDVR